MFKGLGNLGNIASMIGAAQQLPEKIQHLNERMKNERVTASSECGRVEVTISGTGIMQAIRVDSELIGVELEVAVMSASNAAGAAAKERFARAAADMAQEMNLPIPGLDGIIKSMTGNA
jgi:nucleoid-associated protein EbfC